MEPYHYAGVKKPAGEGKAGQPAPVPHRMSQIEWPMPILIPLFILLKNKELIFGGRIGSSGSIAAMFPD